MVIPSTGCPRTELLVIVLAIVWARLLGRASVPRVGGVLSLLREGAIMRLRVRSMVKTYGFMAALDGASDVIGGLAAAAAFAIGNAIAQPA
jgi:hypothetical protein